MITLFRKIRQKLLVENRFSKYLLYALGEIVLVVIGILIALQINNANENKKNTDKVKILLGKIQNELETDISEIKSIIEFYSKKDSLIELVLNDKVKKEDYLKSSSNELHYLLFNRMEIRLKKASFNNLMNYQDLIPEEYDPIISDLKELYNDNFSYVEEAGKNIRIDYDKNENYLFENFEWYSSQKPFFRNEERIDFFLNNVRYKGMVKKYQSTYIYQYLEQHISYMSKAIIIREQINEILKEKDYRSPVLDFDLDSRILGAYNLMNGSQMEFLKKNHRIYIVFNRDTVEIVPYSKNKLYGNRTFIKFRPKNDTLQLFLSNFQAGKIPLGSKIDSDD